jgi:3-methyl-2-oxobutanoate hydroxymethyltransferase
MNLKRFEELKADGEKIAVLTCYDASMATLMAQAKVDALLVGDSLGMVLQGGKDTLGVTVADMAYHTRCVAAGASGLPVIADLPVGGDATPELALENARQLMAAGAHMVKLEGNKSGVVRVLTRHGIPVCGHLGFTPQSVNELGGYKVQGREETAAETMLQDALALQQAGISLLVLEMIPAALGARITQALAIPTIGIGAGPDCSGQVLVVHDALGMYPGKKLKFTRNFLAESGSISAALTAYVVAVKQGQFPAPEHCFM